MTNKFRLFSLCLLSVLVIQGCNMEGNYRNKKTGKVFYVSSAGDDLNAGTMKKPWKSIEKVNAASFGPGDAVYFEGGCTFVGTIELDSLDSGSDQTNFLICSYGEGKAIINGGIRHGLSANNCDHLLVKNLAFIGDGRNEGNATDGVYITGSNDLVIDSLDISGFQHSGLHIHKSSDVKVTHVYAHNNGFAGIHVTGETIQDPLKYDNKNIYIAYCVAENNPGDPTSLKNHSGNGILASSVDGGVIEYCESFNNGWDMVWTGNGPVGIWIWDCTDFIIQYCIAHDNKTNPVAADGGGFDFDGGVSNSVLQYNLSYNNEGSGIGLFEFGAAKTWENNIIRFNISQDDGIINGASVGIWKADNQGTMRNCEIYSNTFYNSRKNGSSIWLYNNYPGFTFRNNIFIYNGSFLVKGQKLKDEVFQGNAYWNLGRGFNIGGYRSIDAWAKATGKEMADGSVTGLFTDPLLVNPGTAALTDPTQMSAENLSAYMLKPVSPLIDRGLDLKEMFGMDPGGRDFFGTQIPQGKGFDIGATEFIIK